MVGDRLRLVDWCGKQQLLKTGPKGPVVCLAQVEGLGTQVDNDSARPKARQFAFSNVTIRIYNGKRSGPWSGRNQIYYGDLTLKFFLCQHGIPALDVAP